MHLRRMRCSLADEVTIPLRSTRGLVANPHYCYSDTNKASTDQIQAPGRLLNQLLIIHERIGFWVRQLRSRMAQSGLKIVETRSRDDIEKALASSPDPCPLALIDLGRRPLATLEELDLLKQAAPNALVLVLDPQAHDEIPLTARTLGATHVISGQAIPPDVARLLMRWKRLANERAITAGRRGVPAESPEPEPEPWNWISEIIGR